MPKTNLSTEKQEFRQLLVMSRAPKLRTMRQFAEAEITLPNTGPKANRKYRASYQPFSLLWYAALESGYFLRAAATGPSQSGKTLQCLVIPAMYHLFEMRENIIVFAPNMEICEEKWTLDLAPIIQRSQYADLLPKTGRGSQGGFSELMQFRNGCYCKFMTGGGGDKNKAAITAKVALGTEIDGMDEVKESSRETDPINQIAARLRSHGSRSMMYLECTVSTPQGRIWQEYQNGTQSKIVIPCPHCDAWVSPERENFLGWDAAETEVQAETLGQFFCPDCGAGWSQDQRIVANQQCKLLHRGQEITPDGEVVGPIPETRTLGFRWSVVNNQFADDAQIGRELWRASRQADRDSAEREQHQFVWCVPFAGDTTGIEITEQIVASRLTGLPRGVVPDDYESLVVQIDLHNRWHYWTVLATSPGNVRSIVDYGLLLTPNPEINGPEIAIRLGLELLAAELDEPGRWKTAFGRSAAIDLHFVDAGYMQDVALEFVTNAGPSWKLMKGEGDAYRSPKEITPDIHPGEHWHLAKQPVAEVINKKWWLILSETNHWLRQVHGGFVAKTFLDDGATRRPGSIALFGDDPSVHLTPLDRTVSRSTFATQILGWKWEEKTTPKTGTVMAWVPQWKEDHWLDTTYGCLVAASFMESVRASERQAKDREDAEREAARNRQGQKFVRPLMVRKS